MTSASRAADHTASASRTSPLIKVNHEPQSSVFSHWRFASTPNRLRLSKTVTVSQRDNSRATRLDPMNPAPPVTKCFATKAPLQTLLAFRHDFTPAGTSHLCKKPMFLLLYLTRCQKFDMENQHIG